MITLTVIVPVYNASQFLRNCLDSLVQQDINPDEYEILCINDGSTDSSADIIKEYMQQYTFISYIEKENEGIAKTRNCGVANAKGEYIAFVDSDDAVSINVFGRLIQELKNSTLKILTYSYECTQGDGEISLTELNELELDCTNIDINMAPFQVWGIIYDRSLFTDNIRFCAGFRTREDYIVNLFIYATIYGQNMLRTSAPIYKYRVREGSLSHIMSYQSEAFQQERLADMIGYIDECIRFISMCNQSAAMEIINEKCYYFACTALLCALRCKNIDTKKIRTILKSKNVHPIPPLSAISSFSMFIKYLMIMPPIYQILDKFNVLRRHTLNE